MSLMRSRYRELDLELTGLREYHSCPLKQLTMGDKKRDDGVEDTIKFLLKESLM